MKTSLFKKEVLECPPKIQWALLSALRGPDDDPDTQLRRTAKVFTIAIRRAVLPDDFRLEQLAMLDYEEALHDYPDWITDPEQLLAAWDSMASHWRDHMEDALVDAFNQGLLDEYGKELTKLVTRLSPSAISP